MNITRSYAELRYIEVTVTAADIMLWLQTEKVLPEGFELDVQHYGDVPEPVTLRFHKVIDRGSLDAEPN